MNPNHYINRELSWLEFNERVLEEAMDKNTDLENLAFNERAVFFEEVFGIKASIRKRKAM